MAGRPRTIDDQALLAATARALARLGYARLNLAAVAQEAGVAPGTLVKRFGSKHGLLVAFLDWALEVSRAGFDAMRARTSSPLEALLDRFLLRLQYVADPKAPAHVLSLSVASLTDPVLRERAAQRVQAFVEQVEVLLRAAVEAGELRPCDVPRLARVLAAAINGAGLMWPLDEARSPEAWMRDVFEVLIDPLRTGPAEPAPTTTSPVDRPVDWLSGGTGGPPVQPATTSPVGRPVDRCLRSAPWPLPPS